MSLIENIKEEVDVKAEQARVQTQIKEAVNSVMRGVVSSYESIFNAIYKDTKLSSQEVYDALGTDGAELLGIATDFRGIVNKYAPNTITLTPPNPLVVNEDGSITEE